MQDESSQEQPWNIPCGRWWWCAEPRKNIVFIAKMLHSWKLLWIMTKNCLATMYFCKKKNLAIIIGLPWPASSSLGCPRSLLMWNVITNTFPDVYHSLFSDQIVLDWIYIPNLNEFDFLLPISYPVFSAKSA